MHNPRLTIACLITAYFAIAIPPATASKVIETKTHRLEQVADGIYFIVGNGSIFVMSNAMAIVTDEDVVVVDSHITPAASRALITSIKSVTDKPITTLINSHFHYDHAHGNQSFGPDIQIIGHEFTRQKLSGKPLQEPSFLTMKNGFERGLEHLQQRLEKTDDAETRHDIKARIEFSLAHIKATAEITPVAPDITLNDRITLFRGGREIQIHFLVAPIPEGILWSTCRKRRLFLPAICYWVACHGSVTDSSANGQRPWKNSNSWNLT